MNVNLDEYLINLIDQNNREWEKESKEEIEERNKRLHALKTLLICNSYINGERPHKWLRENW